MARAVVYCDLPSGLHLDVGPLNAPKVRVTLATGRNEIDADLWAQWLADHSESSLVTDGRVYEEKRAPEPEAKPAAAEAKPAPQPTAAAPKG